MPHNLCRSEYCVAIMKPGSIKFGSRAHTVIRFAYIAVIAVLSLFALLTYRELQRQRSAPVILPSFGFYIVDVPEKASLVQAHGTWYVASGPIPLENLQTTTIECRKTRLQCVESTSVVSVSEQGFLDSIPTVFEVERWTDDEIVTKPEKGRCTTRIISIDLVKRLASSVIAAIPDGEKCNEQPRTLKLESGAKARSDAMEKVK
jgi:hypothetical protein